jgi:hypothetical protein
MLNDVRFAVRSFLKNPEFALACIVTLGQADGATGGVDRFPRGPEKRMRRGAGGELPASVASGFSRKDA